MLRAGPETVTDRESGVARIPGIPKGKQSWLLRYAQRYAKKQVGSELDTAAIMGHQSWLLGGAGAYELASQRMTAVPEKLKSLVGLKAVMMIGCPF